ncbi:MAG: 4-hydroxybenzoate octaprenyltransferase [Deltaproteobacteria bacterium]|nr:4-hydroxybenzoate octaprenyltransferase [Deltaproteobacteria bacterium]NIS78322.1 4-hydroxybenzoate octaprenyltransferase [Deltaproteobacteria bacterium]
MAIFARIRTYLELVKFSHTVFALPFALTGMFLAARGFPDAGTLFFILLAMVGGRSAAMGLNRVVDAEIDRANPRTRDRHIPKGLVKKREAWTLIAVSFLLLLFSAYMLNPLCFRLSPLLIAVLLLYSYTKRFTWASHIVLGLALGAAPLGAWIAVKGAVDPRILLLSFAVMFWVAGFDIIYALLDIDFDRTYGLHSIPRLLGPGKAITVARICHACMASLLLGIYHFFSLSFLYLAGFLVCVALLLYEHSLVREDDFSRLDMAFFNVNGYISITFCLFTFLDIVLLGR